MVPVQALHPVLTNGSNDDLNKVNLNSLNSPIELSDKKPSLGTQNSLGQRESRRDSAIKNSMMRKTGAQIIETSQDRRNRGASKTSK
jgi:hypothetical protein|tara:strand:+ start:257 stop:517 length:261 start_codon:yes stop_codon:yes gene_type:complete